MNTPNVSVIAWNRKRRISFPTKAKTEEYRQVLLAQFAGERYFNPNTNPSVAEVVDHWLENKRGSVKAQTGEKPHRDSKLLLMLGDYKVSELTTAQLRRWHSLIRTEVGAHTANRVMSMLKGILALAEEDFGIRVCSIPTNLARRNHH